DPAIGQIPCRAIPLPGDASSLLQQPVCRRAKLLRTVQKQFRGRRQSEVQIHGSCCRRVLQRREVWKGQLSFLRGLRQIPTVETLLVFFFSPDGGRRLERNCRAGKKRSRARS